MPKKMLFNEAPYDFAKFWPKNAPVKTPGGSDLKFVFSLLVSHFNIRQGDLDAFRHEKPQERLSYSDLNEEGRYSTKLTGNAIASPRDSWFRTSTWSAWRINTDDSKNQEVIFLDLVPYLGNNWGAMVFRPWTDGMVNGNKVCFQRLEYNLLLTGYFLKELVARLCLSFELGEEVLINAVINVLDLYCMVLGSFSKLPSEIALVFKETFGEAQTADYLLEKARRFEDGAFGCDCLFGLIPLGSAIGTAMATAYAKNAAKLFKDLQYSIEMHSNWGASTYGPAVVMFFNGLGVVVTKICAK